MFIIVMICHKLLILIDDVAINMLILSLVNVLGLKIVIFSRNKKINNILITLVLYTSLMIVNLNFVYAEESCDKVDLNNIDNSVQIVDIINDDFAEILFIKEKPVTNYVLTLEDAINTALENNSLFNVQKKQTKVYKIRAIKSILDFLPSFSTSMDYSYSSNIASIGGDETFTIPGVGPVAITGFKVEDRWKRQNVVAVSQEITNLYETYHRRRMADLTFEKALLAEEYYSNNLVLSVYQTFFDVLTLQYQLEAAKKNVDELNALHSLTLEKVKEGTALKRDAQKVEVELDKSKYLLFVKENNLSEVIDGIKYLLGISLDNSIEIKTDYSPFINNFSLNDSINTALEHNQKIKEIELDLKIAKHSKKESYSDYIPDLNVNAFYVNQSGNEFLPKNNFVVSLNMNFKFFDWGKRELTIKEKQLIVDQSELILKDFIEMLKLDVEKKYNKVNESEKLIETSEKAVELSKDNFDITVNRYKVGYALLTDVLSDQRDLAQARSDYYQALFDKQKKIAQLKQVMGLLLFE